MKLKPNISKWIPKNSINDFAMSRSIDEVLENEVVMIAKIYSPLLHLISITATLFGILWNISILNLIIFFVVFIISGILIDKISTSSKSHKTKINIISILVLLCILTTFHTFYYNLTILVFFILIIASIVSIIGTDRTLFFYIASSFPVVLYLVFYVFETKVVVLDQSFMFALTAMILMILTVLLFIQTTYKSVIFKKLKHYEELVEYNEEILQNKAEMEFLAYNDMLTKLPNRKMLMEQLELMINLDSESGGKFALVFIDLDDFKKINDTLGHAYGDKLLIQVKNRLSAKIHKEDILARLGGDELALLVRRNLSAERLLNYVQELCNILNVPMNLDQHKKTVISASFGIAMWPIDGKTKSALLKSADIAMYSAKEKGKNTVQFYRKEMAQEVLSKIELEKRLQKAVKNNEFFLEYQPVFKSSNKDLVFFEALIRWNSPDIGIVPPLQFIELAEEIGLINNIGDWVLEQACNKIKDIKVNNKQNIAISVNISPVQINDKSFIDRSIDIINKSNIDPNCLIFEITETVFVENMNEAVKIITTLKDFGIQIALDDFGSGYSSLKYLMDLPVDILKIDKAFIEQIETDTNRLNIVGHIISMAHCLNMGVVAEGIENKNQLELLSEESCNFIQGFYTGKPMKEELMNRLINKSD